MNPDIQRPNTNSSQGSGSIDGFKPSTPPSPPAIGVPPAQQNTPMSGGMPPNAPVGGGIGARAQAGQQLLNNMPADTKKGGTGSKAVLTVFIVLFVLAAAGAGYLYWQYDSTQKDLATLKTTNSSLSDQLEATQASAAEQATTLQGEDSFITDLTTIAEQLKTQCGDACASINIPTQTTEE